MDTYQIKTFKINRGTFRDVHPSQPLECALPMCVGNWHIHFQLLPKNIKAHTVVRFDVAGSIHTVALDPPWYQSNTNLSIHITSQIPKDHIGKATIEFLVSDFNASIEIIEINGILLTDTKNSKKPCSCEIAMLMNKGCQCGGD